MRPQTKMPSGSAERLYDLMKETQNATELKRLQCVYLRAKYGYRSGQVAEMTGYHRSTVRRVQANYLKEGESALLVKKKGGRYRQNMSLACEQQLLAPFFQKAESGQILEVSQIHQAYADKLGREAGKSTVYAMLHRHGWRKLAPRPKHPKNDTQAIEGFKKVPIADTRS